MFSPKSPTSNLQPHSNVIHRLLQAPRARGLLDELLERHVAEGEVGGLGEFFVDEADGDFAGGEFAAGAGLLGAEPNFQPADQVGDADVTRGAGEAVPPAAADLALQE